MDPIILYLRQPPKPDKTLRSLKMMCKEYPAPETQANQFRRKKADPFLTQKNQSMVF
jgi:hypothetical protein